jgi:hypothetical protein
VSKSLSLTNYPEVNEPVPKPDAPPILFSHVNINVSSLVYCIYQDRIMGMLRNLEQVEE